LTHRNCPVAVPPNWQAAGMENDAERRLSILRRVRRETVRGSASGCFFSEGIRQGRESRLWRLYVTRRKAEL
jgi:hypothetical protein